MRLFAYDEDFDGRPASEGARLLAEYSELLQDPANAERAAEFKKDHLYNAEFADLAAECESLARMFGRRSPMPAVEGDDSKPLNDPQVYDLLERYAEMIANNGVDSDEANDFFAAHAGRPEFVELGGEIATLERLHKVRQLARTHGYYSRQLNAYLDKHDDEFRGRATRMLWRREEC